MIVKSDDVECECHFSHLISAFSLQLLTLQILEYLNKHLRERVGKRVMNKSRAKQSV